MNYVYFYFKPVFMANVEKMLWKVKPDIQAVNQFGCGTLMEQLGIEVTDIGDDYVRGRMPVDQRTKQPMGLLHGGASAALSESLGSVASWLIVMGEGKHVVGIEINANHLRSVTEGYVTGITRPVKVGRLLHVWETQIFDAAERLVCTSRLTVLVKDSRDPALTNEK